MLAFHTHWPDVRVGDTYFVIGHGRVSRREWRKIARTPWYQDLSRDYFPNIPHMVLQESYELFCSANGKEPPWVADLSHRTKCLLRMQWIQSDNFDPLAILPYRQELGFSFAVHNDGLIHDTCNALGIFRLAHIRQLGFLHDPVMNELAEKNGIGMLFEHTRYMHSLTVMATASLMGLRCGLREHDLIHLRVAALTHDVLTPAGGDSIKFIDPEAFDEDAHYHEIFEGNSEWDAVRDRYGLDETLLAATVRGEGILGQLLDLADKMSYVAHDFDAYMKGSEKPSSEHFQVPNSIMEVWKFQSESPYPLCDLWNFVVIENGQVIVTDGKRLASFLKLRALLFRHLYYNPRARYREQILGILIVDPLYRKGILTREQLLQMNDAVLYAAIDAQNKNRRFINWDFSEGSFSPIIERYPNLNVAKERAQSLVRENPATLVMYEFFPSVSSKAIQYLVRNEQGTTSPFAMIYPEDAEEILAIESEGNNAILYILPIEEISNLISPELQATLFQEQRKRIGLE